MRPVTIAWASLILLILSTPAFAQVGPTQAELNDAARDVANWLHPDRDYAGQRYVDLKEINVRSARSLRPVCMYQSAELVPSQTNPIVYRGVIYITTTHLTIALGASDCRVQWIHEWKPKGTEPFKTHRGAAIKDGKLVRGTVDGYLLALDVASGQLLWSRRIADPEGGYFFSMPPLIYEDLIIVGPAGSEWAIKGWIGAFRLEDGEPVWKFNTVPDPGEAGSETWGDDPEVLKHGGGSVWTALSFDLEREHVYVPVGNPAPDFYDDVRPGANLYTNSLVALNIRTGSLEWYYQAVPHDVHDWDLSVVRPIFTTTAHGQRRTIIAVPGKDGLLRGVDRDTREVLYSVPFTTRENVDAPLTVEGVRVCPAAFGAISWNGPAYDPRANLLFVPTNDWCGVIKKGTERPKPEFFYGGGEFIPDPWSEARGYLTAFDASTGDERWRHRAQKPMVAGVTATSGGVLFTGEVTGDFLVLESATGRELFRFRVGSPVAGGVVTYAIRNKQYVAIVAGHIGAYNLFAPEIGGGSPTVVIFSLP